MLGLGGRSADRRGPRWYHGERGQQRVSGPELAVLTLLLLLGGGVLWLYSQRSVPTTTTATAATAGTDCPRPLMHARPSPCCPSRTAADESKDAFFVDGIHDDILTQLSKVSALRVISRTSVEQFRDTKLPMKAIADQLGVTKILEGGVQRAGDRVRVTRAAHRRGDRCAPLGGELRPGTHSRQHLRHPE